MLGETGLAAGPRHRREAVRHRSSVRAGAQQVAPRRFDESDVFRIDHFLGKESVRTSSPCASPTDCSSRSGTATTSTTYRSTCPETLTNRGRSGFYEQTGAYRGHGRDTPFPGARASSPWSRRPRSGEGRAERDGEGVRLDEADRPRARRQGPVQRLPQGGGRRPEVRDRDVRRATRSRSTTGAGPACRSSCAPGRRWRRAAR